MLDPNNMTPEDWKTFIRLLLFILLAWVAGFLGDIMRQMDANTPIKWSRTLVKSASAALTGLLILFICISLDLSAWWTGAIVGLCGWLGADATIRIIEKFVFDKLGISKKESDQ